MTILHIERQGEIGRCRIEKPHRLIPLVTRCILGVILQRNILDLAATRREIDLQYLVLHGELLGFGLLRRSQQLSELHDPTLRLQAVPGQPLSRSRNSCGIRSRQRSVERQERILLGLDTRLFGVVRHELFLILFLLMRIIERETQEDQGHDDNSGD